MLSSVTCLGASGHLAPLEPPENRVPSIQPSSCWSRRNCSISSARPGVDLVIADNGDSWAKFCAGEGKAMGALVGAVMKATQGKADGKLATALFGKRRDDQR